MAKFEYNSTMLTSNEITLIVTEQPITNLLLSSNVSSVEIGGSFAFSVIADNGSDVTANASYFVDDVEVFNNPFTPNATGQIIVKAIYVYEGNNIVSNTLALNVTAVETRFNLFDEVIFYDVYAGTVSDPVPAGITRVDNTKYAIKVTDVHLSDISDKLSMEITIKAFCDNYDRIGHVNISLVDKGLPYNSTNIANTIEVGRYITPFMDKNVQPDEVPYIFEVDNIAKLLKDPAIYANYDFWVELSVFGVPYAANTQIAGCAGLDEVFYGSLDFISTAETVNQANQYIKPVVTNIDFNNYNATDIIGQTIKTINIDIATPITNAQLHLITSNHGANTNGEEYNRRDHYIYFDGANIDMYKPGETSCEPYRQYNTQGNGIYGPSPRSDSQWQSFSNWCPGAKIPIRTYDLGNLNAGTHTFKIEVPDAVFANGEGNIPLSLYIQGDQ